MERTFYNHKRLPQQEDGLFPIRRNAFRARAEARHLRQDVCSSQAGPPLSSEFVAHRPYLCQCNVSLLDNFDFSAGGDWIHCGGEEGVKVEDERVHFGPALDSRAEGEGGGEAGLARCDDS